MVIFWWFFFLFFFFKQIAMLIFNFDSPHIFSYMPNLRGCSELERAFSAHSCPPLYKSMSQKMMWCWQPSLHVESVHCAKALSLWSPLYALHKMMKSGTVTQQLIRMMITPYPRCLGNLPNCSSSLALEDGLTSPRPWVPQFLQGCEFLATAHSAPS